MLVFFAAISLGIPEANFTAIPYGHDFKVESPSRLGRWLPLPLRAASVVCGGSRLNRISTLYS